MNILNKLPRDLQHEVFSYVDIYENDRKNVFKQLLTENDRKNVFKQLLIESDNYNVILARLTSIVIEVYNRDYETLDDLKEHINLVYEDLQNDIDYSLLFQSPFTKIKLQKYGIPNIITYINNIIEN